MGFLLHRLTGWEILHLLQTLKNGVLFIEFRNPLKFTVENALNIQLYPEADEPVNILNIKRGIISALLAPATEEDSSVMVSLCTNLWLSKSLSTWYIFVAFTYTMCC